MAELNYIALHESAIVRFWSKVQKASDDECWMWAAGVCKDGYGKFSSYVDGVKYHYRAHRVSTFLAHGAPPAGEGSHAMHQCDNPGCCNPRHLRWGTGLENIADAIAKGRHTRGTMMRTSILTEEEVREVRILHKYGCGPRLLGRVFNVSHTTVSGIIKSASWKHVT